jgi:hypothetical protein
METKGRTMKKQIKDLAQTERQKLSDEAKKALDLLANALEKDGKLYGANQVRNMSVAANEWGYCQ